jgi:hypothetical protein
MKTDNNTFENFPEWVIEKWQELVDLLTYLLRNLSMLIIRTEYEFIVFF